MAKRKFKLLAGLVSASLLLAACGGSDEPAGPAEPDEQGLITVRLAHDLDAAILPSVVAMKKGFFEKHGLKIEETTVQNIGTLPTALGTSFDIVQAPATAIIAARDQGINLQVISGTSEQTEENPTTSLLVAADSDIQSVKDLEGKSIGAITVSGTIHLATLYWLKQEGVDLDSLKVREVDLPTQADQLAAGRVDAVETVTTFRTGMLESGKVRDLGNPMTKISPKFGSLYWAADQEWAAANPGVLEKFRAALGEAIDYIDQNEAEAREILQEFTGLPDEVIAQTVLSTFTTEAREGDMELWLDVMLEVGNFKPNSELKISDMVFKE